MTTLTDDERATSQARQQKRYRDLAAAEQFDEREHLRSEIPSRAYMRIIDSGIRVLMRGTEETVTPAGEVIITELDSTRQNGIKSAMDACFKMLGKTMPDLKQIEIRADITEEALPQAITYTVVKALEEEVEDV